MFQAAWTAQQATGNRALLARGNSAELGVVEAGEARKMMETQALQQGQSKSQPQLGTPDPPLRCRRGNNQRLAMCGRGVHIDCCRRLRAQVAGIFLKVQRGDAMFTMDADKHRSIHNSFGRIVSHS